MSIDERLQFLLQSTESLHADAQEIHASMRELHAATADLRRKAEIEAENIRGLARIAELHSARLDDHDARLDGLEG